MSRNKSKNMQMQKKVNDRLNTNFPEQFPTEPDLCDMEKLH